MAQTASKRRISMDFELDESCARYDICKKMIGFQVVHEMLLNLAGRTSGGINECEICNLYIKRKNQND